MTDAPEAPYFTAHNIILDDGTETLPGKPLTEQNVICQTALTALKENFTGPPEKVRVADLGSLEGGYAVALARAGYQVTAIEVRERNMRKCCYVAGRAKLPNLTFIQDDARHLPLYGDFDAIFCSGLLYHLDEPVKFLSMLGSVSQRLLILQSHYSTHPVTMNEGMYGHWYQENPSEESVWSSWGNYQSFWMIRSCLLEAISAAGFITVTAHHDENGEQHTGREWGVFTGVKP